VIADGRSTLFGDCRADPAEPAQDLDSFRRALTALLESHAQALERADAAGSAPAAVRGKGWVVALTLSVDQTEYLVLRRTPGAVDLSPLSARQLAVVQLACAGQSNKEIAHLMGISNSTVRVLIFRACRKLKVASRAELIEALSSRLR
jgi:DNA-binding CsgD family transcriptional regulator